MEGIIQDMETRIGGPMGNAYLYLSKTAKTLPQLSIIVQWVYRRLAWGGSFNM